MILWLFLVILLSSTAAEAAVQNCTIAWNARTEADLAGYRVKWGTTTATLTPATLLAPADHATLPSSTKFVILRWSEIRGATSYAVRVVDNTVSAANISLVCPSTVFCVLDLHATSAAVTLKPGRTYTWTVTWTDASGTTNTPAARTFTVDLNE